MNEIGIALIDTYSQRDLDNSLSSIPTHLKDSVLVVSNTKNTIPKGVRKEHFNTEISFAAMKNHAMAQFRLEKRKYYFFIETKLAILDEEFFERVIETAKTFGTWCMVGPGAKPIVLHDDEKNLDLNISPELNSSFLFLYSGIVRNFGYFNEQFTCDEPLEVMDYVVCLQKNGVYPPGGYHPCISKGLYTSVDAKLNKEPLKDKKTADEQSFALFYHLHKFIPGYSDPKPVSEKELFSEMQAIQEAYAQK